VSIDLKLQTELGKNCFFPKINRKSKPKNLIDDDIAYIAINLVLNCLTQCVMKVDQDEIILKRQEYFNTLSIGTKYLWRPTHLLKIAEKYAIAPPGDHNVREKILI
jgi:hypothetical protein